MIRATHLGIAPRASLAMGAAGAIVGGAVAAARSISKVQQGEISREQAVSDVLKESGSTGISTALATAAVSAVGLTGVISLLGFVSVAVGTKYLADKALAGRVKRCASEPAALSAANAEVKPKTKAKKNG